ncbi:MAG: O-succinylbenzoate-CoA ligase MenE [Actinomycetota bacterium]
MRAGGDGPTTDNLVRPTLVRMAALPLHVVEVAPGPEGVVAARAALSDRLAGDGPAFALVPRPGPRVPGDYVALIRRGIRPEMPVDNPDAAFVAATSGSTGEPRGVVVTRDNLRAAVEASWERIPGLRDCAWVLALPVTSIGGFGAIVRAHLAGTPLHALPSVGGAAPFDARDVIALDIAQPFAISLVPQQLVDMLESAEATAWLSQATAVLVGAAATPEPLAMRARDAGVSLVTTYGMTETTGGCVYDGLPLPGVRVEISDDGRIEVIGRQVTAGYRDGDEHFSGHGVDRRFSTSDHGVWEAGLLRITGRTDDVVTVHGVNVALGAIESIIRSMVGVRDCAVVAIPDDRQDHRIISYVVSEDPGVIAMISPGVVEQLGGAARPDVVAVDALPLLPNGKIDRLALRTAGE